MLSLEEALVLRAAKDAEQAEQMNNVGAILGATVGGGVGLGAGQLGRSARNTLGLNKGRKGYLPGGRMAGMLGLGIAGGLLGPGVTALATGSDKSGAAGILARRQINNGQMSVLDKAMAQEILREAYSNPQNLM